MGDAAGDGPVTIYRHRLPYLVRGVKIAPVTMVTVLPPIVRIGPLF
jgi:hypothetical protein